MCVCSTANTSVYIQDYIYLLYYSTVKDSEEQRRCSLLFSICIDIQRMLLHIPLKLTFQRAEVLAIQVFCFFLFLLVSLYLYFFKCNSELREGPQPIGLLLE